MKGIQDKMAEKGVEERHGEIEKIDDWESTPVTLR
jgi:hypothetical protein